MNRGIEYRRGPEAGWQIAVVYGLEPRAVRFELTRSMDGPGWTIGAAYAPFGVEQPATLTEAAEEFLDAHLLRGPHLSLRSAKRCLETARTESLGLR